MGSDLRKLSSLYVFISLKLNRLSHVWSIIKMVNTVFIMLELVEVQIKLQISENYTSKVYVDWLYDWIEGKYMKSIGVEIQGGLLMLLILYLVIYLKKKGSEIILILLYYPILIFILIEVFYCPITFILLSSFQQIHQISDLDTFYSASLGPTCILLASVTVLNNTNRIYFYFLSFFYVALFFAKSSIFLPIIFVLVNFYFLFREVSIVNKVAYAVINVISFFVLLQRIFKSNEKSWLSMIYVGVATLLVLISTLCKSYGQSHSNNEADGNSFLFKCVQKLEQNRVQSISNFQLVKISSIFHQFYEKYSAQLNPEGKFSKTESASIEGENVQVMKDSNNSKILSFLVGAKNLREASYRQFLDIINKKVYFTLLKNSFDMETQKQYLLFRIHNMYKLNEVIDQISDFTNMDMTFQVKKGINSIHEKKGKQKVKLKHIFLKKEVQFAINSSYLLKQQNHQKIEEIQKNNLIHQQYIDQLMYALNNLYSFWQKINMKVLIESVIEENFCHLFQSIVKLKQLLGKIQKGYKAQWQIKMMNIIYQLVDPTGFNKVSSALNFTHQNQHNLLYFVLKKSSICSLSSDFLKLLDCSSDDIVGQHFSKLMPQNILESLKDMGFEQRKQENSQNIHKIPIIFRQYYIQIFEAKFRLQLKRNEGIFYFVFLKPLDKDKQVAHIYISSIDLSVKYISPQFYQLFGLKPEQVKSKLQKNEFYLNNIISNLDTKQIITELVDCKKKSIRCHFSVKNLRGRDKNMFSKTALQLPQKYTGSISIERQFGTDLLLTIKLHNFNENGQLLNELKTKKHVSYQQSLKQTFKFYLKSNQSSKSHYDSRRLTIIANQVQTQSQSQNTDSLDFKIPTRNKNSVKAKLTEEQFCPIQNPYKQKIEQKKSQIFQNSLNLFSNSNQIVIFCAILILLLITNSAILISQCQQQKKSVQNLISNFDQLSANMMLLVSGTISVYQQYIISQNSEAFNSFLKQFGSELTVQKLVEQYSQDIHKKLSKFHKLFASFSYRNIFEDVSPYKLLYPYYTIETDYSSSNLLQYSYNIKLASEKIRVIYEQNITKEEKEEEVYEAMWFLQSNYHTISKLDVPFKSLPKFVEIFFDNSMKTKILVGTFAFLMLLVLSMIIRAEKRNIQSLRQIFHIFSSVDDEHIQKKFIQLSSALQEFLSQVPKDNIKKFSDLTKANKNSFFIYKSSIQHSIKQMAEQNQRLKSQQKEKIVISNKTNSLNQSFARSCKVCTIVALFLCMVAGVLYKLEIDKQEDKVFLNYYYQIHEMEVNELKNSAQMFFYNVERLVSNASVQTIPLIQNKNSYLSKLLSQNFSQAFEQFFSDQSSIIKQNLCITTFNSSLLESIIDCRQIGIGILQKGLVQASEYYDYITQKLKHNQIQVLEVGFRQRYPNFVIHVYIKDRIQAQIQKFKTRLMQHKVRRQSKYMINMIAFGVAFLIVDLFCLAYTFGRYIPRVKRAKKIGRGYFKIVPKETLQTIQVSSYIKQKGLLDKITML